MRFWGAPERLSVVGADQTSAFQLAPVPAATEDAVLTCPDAGQKMGVDAAGPEFWELPVRTRAADLGLSTNHPDCGCPKRLGLAAC